MTVSYMAQKNLSNPDSMFMTEKSVAPGNTCLVKIYHEISQYTFFKCSIMYFGILESVINLVLGWQWEWPLFASHDRPQVSSIPPAWPGNNISQGLHRANNQTPSIVWQPLLPQRLDYKCDRERLWMLIKCWNGWLLVSFSFQIRGARKIVKTAIWATHNSCNLLWMNRKLN